MSKINLITKNNTFEKEIQKNLNNKISGEIRSDEKTRMIYSTDASIYQIVPQAVAFPKSDEDLQIIMEYAFANNIPITPRGGGTSLAGATVGSGIKENIEDWKKWLHTKNITPEDDLKRRKQWLNTWFPGTIKGCIHGSGHSWVRNECHYFNSSVWDLERLGQCRNCKTYNSTWRFVKSCVCSQDNCN